MLGFGNANIQFLRWSGLNDPEINNRFLITSYPTYLYFDPENTEALHYDSRFDKQTERNPINFERWLVSQTGEIPPPPTPAPVKAAPKRK